MFTRTKVGALLAGTLAIATLAVVAVQTTDTSEVGGSEVVSNPYGLPFTAVSSDYEPVDGPDALAEKTMDAPSGGAVVRGEINKYTRGRTYLSGPASSTIVMEFGVDDVYAGELLDGANGKAYIEFDAPGGNRMDEYLRTVRQESPIGTKGIMYLWRMPAHGIFPGVEQVRPGAGRPAGQPLHRPLPQGTYLAHPESQTVVAPDDGLLYDDASLSDFAPPSRDFPEVTRREGGA